MTALVNRHTQAPVRFAGGLSMVIRAFEDIYGNLQGKLLEARARLFVQNVRIYVYPMTTSDLQEWLTTSSIHGWEWNETRWVGFGKRAASRTTAWTSVRLSSHQQFSSPNAPTTLVGNEESKGYRGDAKRGIKPLRGWQYSLCFSNRKKKRAGCFAHDYRGKVIDWWS